MGWLRRRGPWVWAISGGVLGFVGISTISGMVWYFGPGVSPGTVPAATLMIVTLGVVARRFGVTKAFRAWSAFAWFVTTGAILVAWADWLGNSLPAVPSTTIQSISFAIGWSATCGATAFLFYWLAELIRPNPIRHSGVPLSRP